MDLLLLALLLALGAWSLKKGRAAWHRHRARREREEAPGFSPDRPLVIRGPGQLETALASTRCVCGGAVRSLGETPRLGLRVARGRCVECDSDVDVYFVFAQLLH